MTSHSDIKKRYEYGAVFFGMLGMVLLTIFLRITSCDKEELHCWQCRQLQVQEWLIMTDAGNRLKTDTIILKSFEWENMSEKTMQFLEYNNSHKDCDGTWIECKLKQECLN